MGADVFVVYYGVRYVVSDDAELTQLEELRHPTLRAATAVGLEHWWGPLPDNEEDYYFLVGTEIGTFGWEGEHHRSVEDNTLLGIMEDTHDKLRQAGIREAPSLHIQFEPKV